MGPRGGFCLRLDLMPLQTTQPRLDAASQLPAAGGGVRAGDLLRSSTRSSPERLLNQSEEADGTFKLG